jgi:hypothetical protein
MEMKCGILGKLVSMSIKITQQIMHGYVKKLVSDQVQDPTAQRPGKDSPIPTGKKAMVPRPCLDEATLFRLVK